MKYPHIVAIASVLWLITSCTERKETRDVIPLEAEPEQTWLVNLSKDTIIVGNKGTRIKFPQSCFVDSAGSEITDQVKITLKEYYTIQDFISNRLSTATTDGQILQSSGMIFLEARSGNKSLRIKDTSPVTIMFPRVVDADVANLFLGETGNYGEMKWQLLEPVHNDTIVIVKETLTPKRGLEEIYLEKFGEVEMQVQFVIGPDTIPMTDQNQKSFEKILRRTSGYFYSTVKPLREKKEYITLEMRDTLQFYIFETASLGFINCDIFVKDELYPFTVQIGNAESDVFIVLDSLNSVMYPDSVVNTRINDNVTSSRVFKLPKNKAVTIISYRSDQEGGHQLGVTKSNTSKKEISVEQETKTLDQIRNLIKNL